MKEKNDMQYKKTFEFGGFTWWFFIITAIFGNILFISVWLCAIDMIMLATFYSWHCVTFIAIIEMIHHQPIYHNITCETVQWSDLTSANVIETLLVASFNYHWAKWVVANVVWGWSFTLHTVWQWKNVRSFLHNFCIKTCYASAHLSDELQGNLFYMIGIYFLFLHSSLARHNNERSSGVIPNNLLLYKVMTLIPRLSLSHISQIKNVLKLYPCHFFDPGFVVCHSHVDSW